MNLTDSITYRRIEALEEINEVVLLQSEIWSADVVSPLPQLVASIHHGGLIIGAYLNDRLIGFSYGFAGLKNGETYLVSHMTGVRPEYQNGGLGFQLKLKQRERAIVNGYQKIVWTYDPLEIRNGFFNLCKLGAYSRTYLPSYYGEMQDKLNKGLPSDRLLVEWDLCSRRVEKTIDGGIPDPFENEYEILLSTDGEYPSEVVKKINPQQRGYLVSVPSNIQLVKHSNLDAARAWRLALRNVLNEALLSGFIISGVQKKSNSYIHYYMLENKRLEESHDKGN
ncbi:GNAT family N-acetyltransferase [Peribacillus alkalitolerans]|uniref:GNAT family N-acetyltransferase n=1 Tax=Peribacillus alkalitolerans TaxID=1550385 RepID=UPI0013D105EE|nr:GNAT family N-acetyltransferase [Peribacillus alkalitolerans]